MPASNIFFHVGTCLAERLLYVPCVGFCMLVAFSIDQMGTIASLLMPARQTSDGEAAAAAAQKRREEAGRASTPLNGSDSRPSATLAALQLFAVVGSVALLAWAVPDAAGPLEAPW